MAQKNNEKEPTALPSWGSQQPPPGPVTAETAVFGVPLEEAVMKSARMNPNMPDVLTKCIEYILQNAIKLEGVFRISGGAQTMKDLKESFDRGEDIDLSVYKDEHVVTGLLKLYFRELPEPILTWQFTNDLKALEKTDHALLVSKLQSIVQSLPGPNRCVLEALMKLLYEVTQNVNLNKMSVQNVAIVFSPTLNMAIEVLVLLITNHSQIFQESLIQWE